MRMVNLVIMAFYCLNLVIDLFSSGSGVFRFILVSLAYSDFIIFVVGMTRRLSSYLQFPIFGLPANLVPPNAGAGSKPEADSSSKKGEVNVGYAPSIQSNKLENSLDDENQNRK